MTDAHEYFRQVAGRWDEIRAGYFTEHMRDAAIARARLPAGAVVADVGTGTGFVAAALAGRAARVHDFDASPAMLEVARRNLAAFPNVEPREASGDRLPLPDGVMEALSIFVALGWKPAVTGAPPRV